MNESNNGKCPIRSGVIASDPTTGISTVTPADCMGPECEWWISPRSKNGAAGCAVFFLGVAAIAVYLQGKK